MTIDNFQQRKKLERIIIGISLNHSGAFGELMNILSPENFRKWEDGSDHSFVWKVMSEMFPKTEVDLLTVSHYINMNYGINMRYFLTKCSGDAPMPVHMTTYAFILLEMDIRSKFI